ncbi:glycosyltransferase [Clostridium brassicae]|uniref:Glycosyltransferase n=1 Tax=Clostridium brassicae TaxID=2999072 RepID=A0ABT4DBA4_9CLOT|nr:glycosyltransferase [Clostridium brassicae]MCY6959577.1 glycosyltransferase [Clostridium brassicae]
MKLLMMSNLDVTNKNSLGVLNKIFGQVDAFSNYGIDIDLIYNKLHFIMVKKICSNKEIKFRPSSTRDYYNKILNLININKYDVIYVRYPLSNYYFLNFLKSIKDSNSKVKIILDFPTYPYEEELNNERILQIDKFFRRYINKFVDFGVCYNNLNSIFSIPVLKLGNGINLKKIPLKNQIEQDRKELNLIAVANISKWHGYDRLILGLSEYYKEKPEIKVYFNIIGNGNELENLKNLVYKLELGKYVVFHGIKDGNQLSEMFDKSHLAIGSLGMYRIGLKDGATLKVREYCARGIPFVLGYDDLDFSLDFKYAFKATNDNTPINIHNLIEFCNKIHENGDVAKEMRNYAEKNLSWEFKLKAVIEKII